MQRTVHHSRFLADIFHDVYFAALRPAVRGDVLSQHPERGPHSLPSGNLDPRFKAAVGLREEALRFQASRSIVTGNSICASERFFLRGYDEIAALKLCVDGAIRVRFELLIAPAAASEVISPLCGVGSRTVCAVKFVAPGKCVTGRGRNNSIFF